MLEFTTDDCVATKLAAAWHAYDDAKSPWGSLEKAIRLKKTQRAKRWLNTRAAEHMSTKLLHESDPQGDIERWLRILGEMVVSQRCG